MPNLDLDADWLKARETQAVFDALSRSGAETRVVGGAVRNALLGLPIGEIDIATTATPDEVIALAERAGLKAVPTGIEHGTVTVIANGQPFEITTLRRDVETYGRHAKIAFTNSWEDDAKRRDFTLNALYADRDGRVFDPLGGLADLEAGRVRFIGDAEARIREDYLRILRFFRFNAYYGKGGLDVEGLRAAVRLRDGVGQLSAERIGGEIKRILIAPGATRAVEALFDYGLLTSLLGGVPRLARFANSSPSKLHLGFRLTRRSGSRRLLCSSRRTSRASRRACGSPMPSWRRWRLRSTLVIARCLPSPPPRSCFIAAVPTLTGASAAYLG